MQASSNPQSGRLLREQRTCAISLRLVGAALLRKARVRNRTRRLSGGPAHRQHVTTSQATVLVESARQEAAFAGDPFTANQQKSIAQLELSVSDKSTHVYILGMSHVSRQSCNLAAQLIAAVEPEVVLLELCKDRVDLLIDPSAAPPQHWHSDSVDFQGLAQQPHSTYNACIALKSRLKCQPGTAFSACDIEQDCVQLMSSGYFGSVLPVTQPGSAADAPMFVQSFAQVNQYFCSYLPTAGCACGQIASHRNPKHLQHA